MLIDLRANRFYRGGKVHEIGIVQLHDDGDERMAAPGALEYDVQCIVEFIEDQRAEPGEGQKHSPSDCF